MIDTKQRLLRKLRQRAISNSPAPEPPTPISMDRHSRPVMKRAPTSGSITGDQLTREARSRSMSMPLYEFI